MTRRDVIDTERKTPAENAKSFLLSLCVGFTVVMVIAMVLGTIFADEEARRGINYCWSLLMACGLAAALQLVLFTPIIIKSMGYAVRLAIFGICLYVSLVVLAVRAGWFPTGVLGAWVSFTVTYLLILVAATAVYHVKSKKESKELNDRLAEYREGQR